MPMMLAPPSRPPRVTLGDDGGQRRLYLHLRIWTLTALTIVITGWLCSYGWVVAILALAVAKHVLVAILAMGLGIDAKEAAAVEKPGF